MPKMKTRRGAAKRFRFSGSGKVRRRKAYLRHILSTKKRKRKRNLGKPADVAAVDVSRVKRMLPYGG